ncbi:MAG: hypothetical protein WCJ46_03425 [bacterium]
MSVLGHLVFMISWVFYVLTWNNTGTSIVYPVIVFPAAAYGLMWLAAFFAGRLSGEKLGPLLKQESSLLVVFALLSLSPLMLKLNIPDPHNFTQRKLEIVMGGTYVLYLAALSAWFFTTLARQGVINTAGEKTLLKIIAVFFFVFYFALSLWLNYANEPAGDEPIYLLTAHSIIYDRDLNLKNNYEKKDYASYYSRELKSQETERAGKLYSYHPVLSSVIIAPFYALAGRAGATLAANTIAALAIALLFLFLLKTGETMQTAFFTAGIAGFFTPAMSFSNQLCADVLSGVLVLAVFIIILYYPRKLLVGAIIAALLPWAHVRNLIIWGVLGIILIVEYFGKNIKTGAGAVKEKRINIKELIIFGAIQGLSFGLWVWFNFVHYGSFIPRQTQADIKMAEAFSINIKGVLGLMFDQEFGAFIYVPLMALCFAGVVFLYKKNKKLFWYSLAVFVPYFAVIASWLDWRGGGGAFPRLLLPVLFIIYLWLSQVISKLNKTVLYLTYSGLAISLIMAALPWFRWNKGLGWNWILRMIENTTHIEVTALFPSLWTGTLVSNILTLLFWLVVVVAGNIYIINKRRG